MYIFFFLFCLLHFLKRIKPRITSLGSYSFFPLSFFFFTLSSFLLILNWFALDIDAYFERLKEELNMVEAESTKISNEIEILARTNKEGKDQYWLFMYKPVCKCSQVFFIKFVSSFLLQILPNWRHVLKGWIVI